jgi:hypothetical protein
MRMLLFGTCLLLLPAVGLSLADSPSPLAGAPPNSIAGDWRVQLSGLPGKSTCAIPPPEETSGGVRLEQDGSAVPITLRDEPGGRCVDVRGRLSGNVLTYSGSQTVQLGPCVARAERSGSLIVDWTRMSGTEQISYMSGSGDCGFLRLPCVWRFSLEAERCAHCWQNCTR